jgi:hypothetical protein
MATSQMISTEELFGTTAPVKTVSTAELFGKGGSSPVDQGPTEEELTDAVMAPQRVFEQMQALGSGSAEPTIPQMLKKNALSAVKSVYERPAQVVNAAAGLVSWTAALAGGLSSYFGDLLASGDPGQAKAISQVVEEEIGKYTPRLPMLSEKGAQEEEMMGKPLQWAGELNDAISARLGLNKITLPGKAGEIEKYTAQKVKELLSAVLPFKAGHRFAKPGIPKPPAFAEDITPRYTERMAEVGKGQYPLATQKQLAAPTPYEKGQAHLKLRDALQEYSMEQAQRRVLVAEAQLATERIAKGIEDTGLLRRGEYENLPPTQQQLSRLEALKITGEEMEPAVQVGIEGAGKVSREAAARAEVMTLPEREAAPLTMPADTTGVKATPPFRGETLGIGDTGPLTEMPFKGERGALTLRDQARMRALLGETDVDMSSLKVKPSKVKKYPEKPPETTPITPETPSLPEATGVEGKGKPKPSPSGETPPIPTGKTTIVEGRTLPVRKEGVPKGSKVGDVVDVKVGDGKTSKGTIVDRDMYDNPIVRFEKETPPIPSKLPISKVEQYTKKVQERKAAGKPYTAQDEATYQEWFKKEPRTPTEAKKELQKTSDFSLAKAIVEREGVKATPTKVVAKEPPAATKAVEKEVQKQPTTVSTPSSVDWEVQAKEHGIKFNGMQERPGGSPIALFTDPKSGSTFSVEPGGSVVDRLSASRKVNKVGKEVDSRQAPPSTEMKTLETEIGSLRSAKSTLRTAKQLKELLTQRAELAKRLIMEENDSLKAEMGDRIRRDEGYRKQREAAMAEEGGVERATPRGKPGPMKKVSTEERESRVAANKEKAVKDVWEAQKQQGGGTERAQIKKEIAEADRLSKDEAFWKAYGTEEGVGVGVKEKPLTQGKEKTKRVLRSARSILDNQKGSAPIIMDASEGIVKIAKRTADAARMTGARIDTLLKMAGRSGKSVEEFAKGLGFDPDQVAYLKKLSGVGSEEVKVIAAPIKAGKVEGKVIPRPKPVAPELPKRELLYGQHDTSNPHQTGEVVKQRNKGSVEKPLWAPAIREGEKAAVQSFKELKHLPGNWSIEIFTETIEKMGRVARDLVYLPMAKASHNITVEARSIIPSLKKLGLSGTERKRLGLWQIAQREGGTVHLAKMGVKVPTLTTKEVQAGGVLTKGYEDFFNRLQDARVISGLEPFNKRYNYVTFFQDYTALENMGFTPNHIPTALLEKKMAHLTSTPFHHLKSRRDVYALKTDAFDIYKQYATTALKHIHLGPEIAKGRELINNYPKLTKDGKGWSLQKESPNTYAAITEFYDYMTGVDPNVMKLQPWQKKAISQLTNNVAVSTMGGNFRSTSVQPTSLLNSWIEIGTTHLTRGILDLFTPGNWAEAELMSNHMLSRGFDVSQMSVYKNTILGGAGKALQGAKRVSMKPLSGLDYVTALATWRGAFRKHIAENRGASKEAAGDYADQVVVRTQGSASMIDRAPIQRHIPGRALTVFQTFTLANWSFLKRHVVGIGNAEITTPRGFVRALEWVGGAALINILFENILQTQSPFPAPITAYKEAREKGRGKGEALLQVGLELMQPLPLIGSMRFGSTPMGAVLQLANDIAFKASGRVGPSKSIPELAGKVAGIPGTVQASKTLRAIKKGATPLEALFSTKPPRKRAVKGIY